MSTAQTSAAMASFLDRISKRTAATFILLAALWLLLWRQLSGEWSVNDQYSYGWFVPFFAAFLFWLRWEDRPTAGGGGQRSEVRSQTSAGVEARVPTRTTNTTAAEDSRHYTELRSEDQAEVGGQPPPQGYVVPGMSEVSSQTENRELTTERPNSDVRCQPPPQGYVVPGMSEVSYQLSAHGSQEETESGSARPNNRQPITDNRAAIAIAIVALALLLPLRLFEIANPDWRPLSWIHAGLVTTLTLLIIWYTGGRPWVRHFAFPVLFVFVAVPWITPVEVPIVQGLMRLVATIATEAVSLFGIPAQLEGNLIRVSNGVVGVNEACSGVRSLQTSIMIGLLFGELKRLRRDSRAPIISGLSVWSRVILVFAAAAIAFVGNCARAFFLVWIAATKNVAAVDRWHDLAGYGILAAVFVGSMLLASWMSQAGSQLSVNGYQGPENREQITDNATATRHIYKLPTSYLGAALIWLVGVEIIAATWYRGHERNLVDSASWEIQWPHTSENFRQIKIDDTVQRILRFDEGQAAAWSWPGFATLDLATSFTARPPTCSLFFFRWKPGKNSALLANLHRPDVCLPAVGWQQVADSGVKNYPVQPGLALPFRHFEFRHGSPENPNQQVAHAFYCLWEDRAPSSSAASRLPGMTTARSAWTRGERLRAVLEGRRHLGQQVMELVIQTRGAIDSNQAEARFGQTLPALVKVTSGK